MEDYSSSSESIQEDNDDNEIDSSPEDEDMHIPHDNEDLSDHDFEANENMIDRHNDNENEREISTDVQETGNGNIFSN